MILFIDIETVSEYSSFAQMPPGFQKHWLHKQQFLRLKEDEVNDPNASYKGHAGIFAEWSKVVCIGLGYYDVKEQNLKTKAITGHNEVDVLQEFKKILAGFRKVDSVRFCGHNIKEFDLPFLCRRYVIHDISLPDELMLAGLKPWENNHIDTMNLWRFGEYKRFTSLDLLALCLGIESPKGEMDGSQVGRVYYEENDLEKIERYCLQDVTTTAQVYFRLTGEHNR